MPKWVDSFLIMAVLLLGAALRLSGIDAQSIWFDEGWSAMAAAEPTAYHAAQFDQTNPPLYYTLLHLHATYAGSTIFALRWFSFALGMLALALTVPLMRKLRASRAAVLIAVMLAAVNIPLWWAAQEMRMYSLLAALLTVCALAWEQLRTHPTRRAWAALALAELALLYSHNTGPVIVLWLNIAALGAWLIHRKPPLLRWIASQVIVGILWLPYFVARFLDLSTANSALVRHPTLDASLWAGLWVAPWEFLRDHPTVSHGSLVILAALLILNRWRTPFRWLLAHLVVLIGGLLLALTILGNELHGRYLVMIVPLAVALLAEGLARLPRYPRWGLTLLIAGGMVWGGLYSLRHPAYQHDDTERMVQHYQQTLGPEDTVIAWSYADRYELAYYWDQWGVNIGRVTLPEGADLNTVRPLLPTDGDVSLNVWYTQRADYRGMMACVLGHGTITPPTRYEVNGMATLTYQRPTLVDIPTQPLSAAFSVGNIIAAGVMPTDFTANQRVCLPIQLQLMQPTQAELKAAVIVLNPLGDEIARADAVFATANQRTSIDGTVGETLTAYPLLALPPGAPPTTYTVILRLYDDAALSGYDFLRDGSPAGKDYPLATWVPIPGAVWNVNASGLLSPLDDTAQPVFTGETVSVELEWALPPDAPLPPLTWRAEGGAALTVPPIVQQHDNRVLDWRRFQIPLDAPTGPAALTLPDGTVIARYAVNALPILLERPDMPYPTDGQLPGIGRVIGYDVAQGDTNNTLRITLAWQAEGDIPTDYTVFVQVLDANGLLIGQSDSPPAAGERPTSTWRSGEYILDTHTVRFQGGIPQAGPLTLIAGMYDANGVRLLATDGRDFLQLGQGVGLTDTRP